MKTEVFARVMEVEPNDQGEGIKMSLLWDGEGRALAIAEFDGQEVTTDITPHRLHEDVRDLQEQACTGGLQVAFRDEALIKKLEELYG